MPHNGDTVGLFKSQEGLIPWQMQGSLHCFWVCTVYLDLLARCWWEVLSLLQVMQLSLQPHILVPTDGLLDFYHGM